jgi:hypothetical protein
MSMILLEPAYKIFHTSVKFKRRTISVTTFSRNYDKASFLIALEVLANLDVGVFL